MTSRPDPLPESACYRFRHIRPTAATCPSRASLVTLITAVTERPCSSNVAICLSALEPFYSIVNTYSTSLRLPDSSITSARNLATLADEPRTADYPSLSPQSL